MSTYRFSFTLPADLRPGVPIGRRSCPDGCILIVNAAREVAITGHSHEAVFDQARRLLREYAQGHGTLEIAAVLRTPSDQVPGTGGSDSWTIIVDAAIAIVPGSNPGRIYDAETGEPLAAALAPA